MPTKNKRRITRESKTDSKDAWLSPEAFVLLGIMFIAVQGVGVFVAKQLFLLGYQQPIFTTDINDITNAFYLFGSILLMTLIVILLIKLKRTKKLIWAIEFLSILATTIIVFSAILPTNDTLVLLICAAILLIRYTNRQNITIRTLVSLISIAGAGALIGISLGLIPVLAFIIILAVYDIIAVFYTKHMVSIGKASLENNFAFTVSIPTEKHKFELGNGDLVIPLMVASSIIVNANFVNNAIVAGIVLAASYVGLVTSIYLVSVKKIPMPALPPQTLLMILTIIGAIIIGL